jgi:hypothetical protein
VSGRRPRGRASRSLEAFLDVLLRAGFAPDDALGAVQAVTSFDGGFVLEELADAGGEASGRFVDERDEHSFPHLRAVTPRLERLVPDERFAFGIDVLIAGLRHWPCGRHHRTRRLARRRRSAKESATWSGCTPTCCGCTRSPVPTIASRS